MNGWAMYLLIYGIPAGAAVLLYVCYRMEKAEAARRDAEILDFEKWFEEDDS
jgi:hypothetical protein